LLVNVYMQVDKVVKIMLLQIVYSLLYQEKDKGYLHK